MQPKADGGQQELTEFATGIGGTDLGANLLDSLMRVSKTGPACIYPQILHNPRYRSPQTLTPVLTKPHVDFGGVCSQHEVPREAFEDDSWRLFVGCLAELS